MTGCTGAYEAREVVHTVRHGGRIRVIEHVPADVCAVCGDVLFAPETVRHLEVLRETTAAPTGTVPLFDYATFLSAQPEQARRAVAERPRDIDVRG